MKLLQTPSPYDDFDCFIPCELEIDSIEHASFLESDALQARIRRSFGTRGLNYFGVMDEWFPRTKHMIDAFLGGTGLIAHQFSLFIAEPNVKSHRIHCDGLMWQGQPTRLDARLNFFHLSPGSGILAYWKDGMETTLDIGPMRIGDEVVATRCGYISEWSNNWKSWDAIPEPSFCVDTCVPSGFVHTSIPHTVLQGPQQRITVSAMIIDAKNNSVTGVWDKLKRRFT